ncbi:MAG: HEAT repeat domain-containing protein [Planctomycetes bacterium]|uniref:HEAT repeat domain-containing protein n=1 Tax=Candidatus Wunengus sp. YC65 TaxID=3367701 RepID=UPI001D93607B|nr:HEAT repeat domain-containing protein [Planctomycetota bacterium]
MNKNMRYFLSAILFLMFFPITSVFAEDTKRPEIITHHGVLEDVPENTFAALRRAVELGVDGIEIDIRQTKDNQLILMCDETIDRTTDGKGRVDRLLYAEIQQYDAGSWRGAEFKNEPVPLLSDVLKFCKMNNLKLILNVKQTCLEKQVLDLVKANEMSPQVYLWGTLRNFNPEDAELFGKELVYVSPEEITEEKFDQIHEEKKYVFTSLLNNDDRKTLKKWVRMGVDVILVDYPCVAMDILNIHRQIVSGKKPFKNREINRPQLEADNDSFVQEKVKTLVKTMADDDSDKARNAASAMMVLPQRYTVLPLLKLLKNKHPQVKQNAVWTLGFCGDESTAAYLHSLLNDKNVEVRRETVLALKRLGATQSVPILIETLRTEKDQGVKYDIARALGMPGNQSAVYALINALMKEKNWYVKSACIEALGRIGSDKAMSILFNILITDAGEDAAWARTKAAWALAAIGEKSIPLLTNALRDNEESTRRRAGWALIKIGNPSVKLLISSLREINKFTRERVAQTLGWIGDERAVNSLLWALKDEEPSVVSAAAWALGRIGSPAALSELQSLVNNENIDIRENAVEAGQKILANKERMAYFKESVRKP